MIDPMRSEPVRLTIHSLSVPQEGGVALSRRMAMGRVKMLGLLFVCALPVMASYFTYYVARPQARSNYGTLVDEQPMLPSAADLALHSLDGEPFDPARLKGQWLLVVVGAGACDAGCERLLWLQRQLREALGKEKDRVDRLWLVSDDAVVQPMLMPAMQGAQVLRARREQIAAWLQPEAPNALEDHLYLVDPLGRWMMRFPSYPDAKQVKRDLERLLRAAAFWDRAGRGQP